MLKRTLTGVVALAITLVGLTAIPPYGAWLLLLIAFTACVYELVRLTPSTFVEMPTLIAVLAASFVVDSIEFVILIPVLLWAYGSLSLCFEKPVEGRFIGASAWVLAGFFAAFLLSLMESSAGRSGALLIALIPLWVGDSLAYFVGIRFGRHKLMPEISPNKTWEGALANLAGCLLAAWCVVSYAEGTLLLALFVGLSTGVLGQVGDLLQSRLKRQIGVKDSSSLLPGHGGLLDRLDSFLFSVVPTMVAFFLLPDSAFHVKHWPF